MVQLVLTLKKSSKWSLQNVQICIETACSAACFPIKVCCCMAFAGHLTLWTTSFSSILKGQHSIIMHTGCRTNSDLWDQNAIGRSQMSTSFFNFFLHDINKIIQNLSLKVFTLKINHLQLSLQVLNLGCCSPRRLSRSKRSWALICSQDACKMWSFLIC